MRTSKPQSLQVLWIAGAAQMSMASWGVESSSKPIPIFLMRVNPKIPKYATGKNVGPVLSKFLNFQKLPNQGKCTHTSLSLKVLTNAG